MSASYLLVIGSFVSNSIKAVQNANTEGVGNIASAVSTVTTLESKGPH